MEVSDILSRMLMYVVLPLWLTAGFADYLCHRTARIENTSGWKESALHLLQFAEMALAVLAALFLEITSLVILIMIACLVLHQATAMLDVHYANATRRVMPIEQHIHSVLEMLPLTALLLVVAMHWQSFSAIFGMGTPDYSLRWKQEPLPIAYIGTILTVTALLDILPYLEEFVRTLRRGGGTTSHSEQRNQ